MKDPEFCPFLKQPEQTELKKLADQEVYKEYPATTHNWDEQRRKEQEKVISLNKSTINELQSEVERLKEALKYAHNKSYILYHTKDAVSKQCQSDIKKQFHALEKALQSPPGEEEKEI